MSNNKQNHIGEANKMVSSLNWLMPNILELTLQLSNKRISQRICELKILELFEQAKAMYNEETLTNYSDGCLEGFNRALDLVELTVEEYKYDIFYDRGLVKIHDRIKELRG
tara:strand:+ start:201 stop:533 length:333 start_codon:yes stop_codon:yes gene_type:complete